MSIAIDTVNSLAGDDLNLVKGFLSISCIANGDSTDDTTHDELLKFFINAASERINYICGGGGDNAPRLLRSRTNTEYHSGRGDKVIFPLQYPITDITGTGLGIWDDLGCLWPDTTKLDSGIIRIVGQKTYIELYGGIFTYGPKNIKLVYKAGYETIPAIITEVCLEIIRFWYLDTEERRSGVTTRTIHDGSMSIQTVKIPKEVTDVLEVFTRKIV